MATKTTGQRSRLTPEREAELYEAVLDLLREVGYDALTMDAISARTRCSKATLYRQWGGKPELVVTALRNCKPHSLGTADTGSLRGDLHATLHREDDDEMRQGADLMRGLAQAIHTNPDLRRALRELLLEPETAGLRELLQRAVDRGEIRADNPALDYVMHMLAGAHIVRQILEDRTVDRDFMIAYIDAVVLPALGA
ncbi:TetR/AcrR family transcriptional regulator [Streptomyces sp. M19]